MAITLVDSVIADSSNNGNDVTLTPGGSEAEGDIYVVIGGYNRASGTDEAAGPTTAGYTQAADADNASGAFHFGCWYKVQGATPDADVTCNNNGQNTSGAVYMLLVLRGVDTSTPIDVTATLEGDQTGDNSTFPNPPSITTVTDDAWVIAAAGEGDAAGPGDWTAIGGGYDNFTYDKQNETAAMSMCLGTTEVATAGATDPSAVSGGNAPDTGIEYTSITVAFRPATSGLSVTAGNISSGNTLNAPTIAHTIDTAAIASGLSLFAPTVALNVIGSTITSTLSLLAPTVVPGSGVIIAGTIASALSLFAPTVSPGAVTVIGASITSGHALNAPTVAHNVDAATISSGHTLNVPTVTTGAVEVVGATIASGLTLFAPSLDSPTSATVLDSDSSPAATAIALDGTGIVADELHTLHVVALGSGTPTPDVSGGGITWNLFERADTSDGRQLMVFEGIGPSPDNSDVDITTDSSASLHCTLIHHGGMTVIAQHNYTNWQIVSGARSTGPETVSLLKAPTASEEVFATIVLGDTDETITEDADFTDVLIDNENVGNGGTISIIGDGGTEQDATFDWTTNLHWLALIYTVAAADPEDVEKRTAITSTEGGGGVTDHVVGQISPNHLGEVFTVKLGAHTEQTGNPTLTMDYHAGDDALGWTATLREGPIQPDGSGNPEFWLYTLIPPASPIPCNLTVTWDTTTRSLALVDGYVGCDEPTGSETFNNTESASTANLPNLTTGNTAFSETALMAFDADPNISDGDQESGLTFVHQDETAGTGEDIQGAVAYRGTDAAGTYDVGWDITSLSAASVCFYAEIPESSGASAQEVTGGNISSGNSLAAPTVAYNVDTTAITSTLALSAPTVSPGAVTVTGATISSTLTLTAPIVAYNIDAATIPSGLTLAAPTVTTAVTVIGATIASTLSLAAPTVAYNIDKATISSGLTLFAPSVAAGAVAVTGGTIASGLTLNAPIVAYSVNKTTISSGLTLFAPTITTGAVEVTAGTVASTLALNAPTVAYNVDTAIISSTLTLAAPTVTTAVSVIGQHIASAVTLNVADVAYQIDAAVISSTLSLNAPTVSQDAQIVEVATVASTLTLSAPTVAYNVDTAAIASTLTLAAPVLAYAVDTAAIASTLSLFAATISPGAVEVEGATISSGLSLFTPSITEEGTITAATIASGLTLNAPTVAYIVDAVTITSGLSLNAPTVAYTIDASSITSTLTLSAPTVAPGAVTVTGATISSTLNLFAPSIVEEGAVVAGTIASGHALNVPTVAYRVDTATITSTLTLAAPTVAYNIDKATISSGLALFAPTVTTGAVEVVGATIASTLTLAAPSIVEEGAIVTEAIASTLSLFAPTLATGAVEVTTATIASGLTLAAPTVDYQIVTETIASGLNLSAPTVSPGAVTVTNSTISSTLSLFAPVLAYSVDTAVISSTETLNAPVITTGAVEVEGSTIASGSALSAPSVGAGAFELTGAHINNIETLLAPTVAYNVDTALIPSGETMYPITIDTVVDVIAAAIPSGSELFGPTVFFIAGVKTLEVSTLTSPITFRVDTLAPTTFSVETIDSTIQLPVDLL